MSEHHWPHGTGGRCGDVFARHMAERFADIRAHGLRGALEHWVATGRQGPAVLEVLTEGDWAAMERAWTGRAGL